MDKNILKQKNNNNKKDTDQDDHKTIETNNNDNKATHTTTDKNNKINNFTKDWLKEINDISNKKINSLKEKIKNLDNEILRNYAEIDNIRKRSKKDIEKAHKYSLKKISVALLPIIDSMEISINSYNSEKNKSSEKLLTSIIEGNKLTIKMFISILKQFGIVEINPIGKIFDPHEHEAMSTVSDAKKDHNTVIKVLQKGYKLNERIIRPARVIVVKK